MGGSEPLAGSGQPGEEDGGLLEPAGACWKQAGFSRKTHREQFLSGPKACNPEAFPGH